MGNEDDDQERKSTKRKDSTKSAEVSTKCSIAIESCASGRDNFAQQPSTSSAMILMGADQRRCSSTSSSDSNKSTQSSFSSSSSTSSSPSEEDDDSDVEEGRQASKKRRHKQRRVTATADDLNAHEYRPGADDDGDLTGDALRSVIVFSKVVYFSSYILKKIILGGQIKRFFCVIQALTKTRNAICFLFCFDTFGGLCFAFTMNICFSIYNFF